VTVVFYRFRRAKPPKTSFYQPVRIKQADVRIGGVMDGPGQVAYMKLAFTNPDYLNVFANANRDAIKTGSAAQVKELVETKAALGEIEKAVENIQEVGPRRNVRGTRGE